MALLAVLCLNLAGCCPPRVATLTVSQVPWPDEEMTSYVIEDQQGNEVGNAEIIIAKEGETYVLTSAIIVSEATDEIIIRMKADDLKPISENRTLYIPPGRIIAEGIWQLNASYNASQLTLETETPMVQKEPYTVDVPEDAFAYDQVLCLLRTLPYKEDYTASYTNIIIWPNLEMPTATVTVTSRETVEAPAGSFDCHKLEVSLENVALKYYFWYGVNEPHYLIKYDNGFSIFLLTEHP